MKYYVLEGTFDNGHPTGATLEKEIALHLEYLQPFFDDGTILVSGPKVGVGGGILILRCDDIEKFCNDDPLVKVGIQKYRATEFSLHDCQDYLKNWFE